MKKKVGLVGCGFIGSEFAKAIDEQFSDFAELVAVNDIDKEKALQLLEQIDSRALFLPVPDLVEQADLIVEAASGEVVPSLLQHAVDSHKDIMIISTGGLLNAQDLLDRASQEGIQVYIPSGAIGGIDALKSAAIGKLYSVQITTKKPVEGLRGAPYIEEKGIDLDSIIGEEIIFEGKAVDAIKHFPKNVNVAVTLSLAGLGAERTSVRIMTSRMYKKNTHEIIVEGDFGRMTCVIENEPSPVNPKTSYLASLSCIAAFKKIVSGIVLGT